jgi:hypothetical protein
VEWGRPLCFELNVVGTIVGIVAQSSRSHWRRASASARTEPAASSGRGRLRPERLVYRPTQNNLISKFTTIVSAIESTIDQTRQPGMKRICVRSPDRFQITNMAYAPCPAA